MSLIFILYFYPYSYYRFENLVQRFGHVYWRFSDTHGEMMSMKTYAKYITNIEGMTFLLYTINSL